MTSAPCPSLPFSAPGASYEGGAEEEQQLADVVEAFGGHVLDDSGGHFTVELISGGSEIDRFLVQVADVAEVETLVRSGVMAVTKGAPISTMG